MKPKTLVDLVFSHYKFNQTTMPVSGDRANERMYRALQELMLEVRFRAKEKRPR